MKASSTSWFWPGAVWLFATCVLWGASPAQAQLFSPGELHKKHAKLEGLRNCLECHESGNKLSDTKCLTCHKPIAKRISRGTGYHGTVSKRQRCDACHREHKGRKGPLIQWEPAKQAFNHVLTGYKLLGKHRKTKCTECHQPRRIADAQVKKRLQRKLKTETFLGMPVKCQDCHFDEHRGQLKSNDCKKCHTPKAFKPATGFSHNRNTRFRLTGKHKRVRCAKCHASKKDDATSETAFPAPLHPTFASYRPIAHNRCTDCHRDPHRGQRGRRCTTCHTTKGWGILKETAKDIGFHKKTRFPLVGEHIGVACKTCHGPHGRQKRAVFKNIPFARCDDCHHDAHVGQLDGSTFKKAGVEIDTSLPTVRRAKSKKGDGRKPDCRQCHSEGGFAPVQYESEDHQRPPFALKGAHGAVSCRECHAQDRKLSRKVPRAVKKALRRQGRAPLVSATVLVIDKKQNDCAACHKDEHGGQFASPPRPKDCASCHSEDAFTTLSKFNHDRDTTYPLRGKHIEAPCHHCHTPPANERTSTATAVVAYRGINATCSSCHVDIHAGQFADGAQAVDCATCHIEDGFVPASKFDHQNPAFTTFALKGKHQELECAQCHRSVLTAGSASPPGEAAAGVTWYRGVPRTCAGCHVDQHEGQFNAYVPAEEAP